MAHYCRISSRRAAWRSLYTAENETHVVGSLLTLKPVKFEKSPG